MTIRAKRAELRKLRARLPAPIPPDVLAMAREVAVAEGVPLDELLAQYRRLKAELRGMTEAQAEAKLLAIINQPPPRPRGLEA